MKIGPWGKIDFFIINFYKNKMQLNFQMNRLTLTIQLKNNCSWVISKILKVTGFSLCPIMKDYYLSCSDYRVR